MTALCQACTSPVGDAFVCEGCGDELLGTLHGIGALLDDLEVTLCRMARIGERSGPRPAFGEVETPLAFHEGASDAAWVIDRVLLAWACTLADDHHVPFALPALHRAIDPSDRARILPARGRAASTAAWLAERIDWLRGHHEAGEALDEITDAVRNARRVIDLGPELSYAGPCQAETDDGPCLAEVYARRGALDATCRACGTEHDMVVRREFLLRAAQDQLLTAPEASRALPGLLGRPVTAASIRGYAFRGKLTPHPPDPRLGRDAKGRAQPLFRVGDLLDVLVDESRENRKTG